MIKTYRIGQVLSLLGLSSRRGAADFLSENAVTFRGKRIEQLNFRLAMSEIEELFCNGKPVKAQTQKLSEVILYSKPVGVTCSLRAFKNDPGLTELPFLQKKRLFYAGRLDRDSRGLIVFSADGNHIHQLSHPSHGIRKKYHVRLNRPASAAELEKIRRGIWSDGEKLQVLHIRMLKPANYECVLNEGKNREIRRIFKAVHLRVEDLCRVEHGPYQLAGLKPGEYVYTKRQELRVRAEEKKKTRKEVLQHVERDRKRERPRPNRQNREVAAKQKDRN